MSDDITLGAGFAVCTNDEHSIRIYLMDVHGEIREIHRNSGNWHKGSSLSHLQEGDGKVGTCVGASSIGLDFINVYFIRGSDLRVRAIAYGDGGDHWGADIMCRQNWFASATAKCIAATIIDKKQHMRRCYWQFDDHHVWEVVQREESFAGSSPSWQWGRGADFGPAMKGTGVACIAWGEVPGNMRVFFQNEKGVIIEKAWDGSSWSTREITDITDAVARTPLAVAQMDDDHIRLFYVNREWKVKEKITTIRRVSHWGNGWIDIKVAANTHIAATSRPFNTIYVQEGTNGSAISEWSWAMKGRSWTRTKESIPVS
ncbi:hypothetical protein CDD80_5351 [Ophiocordyceps camponoti-rufipedis]|uniref:Uncharacterized protein n=1 Tax=Ophiocordyceps camponoti-rufipedis TaxID=2004952 RepID=A0A2C5YVH7_9HYPO|nr:hypothetical protein CDD80_5351 [Ophiocordyceps camponoti-rufipedis]